MLVGDGGYGWCFVFVFQVGCRNGKDNTDEW